jgi:hypothetical protein
MNWVGFHAGRHFVQQYPLFALLGSGLIADNICRCRLLHRPHKVVQAVEEVVEAGVVSNQAAGQGGWVVGRYGRAAVLL